MGRNLAGASSDLHLRETMTISPGKEAGEVGKGIQTARMDLECTAAEARVNSPALVETAEGGVAGAAVECVAADRPVVVVEALLVVPAVPEPTARNQKLRRKIWTRFCALNRINC